MEQLSDDTVHPHLRRVLKTYQTAAVRSLKGPKRLATALYLSDEVTGNGSPDMDDYRQGLITTKKLPSETGMEYDPFLAPPPFPTQQMPILTPADSSRSEKSDTTLEGETIACFSVGGEKRLCLPQILNTVLREFSLQDINAVCDELHIFCSRCSLQQLGTLKVLSILPLSAPSCGLITKTDAERLCNALTYRKAEKSTEPPTPDSFKIYHECFGKCKGVFNPELYSSPHVKCVQCLDCRCMFTPQKFVCHSHKALENRTCHWGFDSSNWRSYLLLAKDQDCTDKLQEVLEQIKARFDTGNKYKRKQSPDRELTDQKRVKNEETWVEQAAGQRSSSAFRPWSPGMLSAIKDGKVAGTPPVLMRDGLPRMLPPYLHTGPPVLLNPERVVPHTETSRFEHHYAPNVALAPLAYKSKEDEKCDEGMGALQKLAEAAASRLSPPGKEYELSTDTEGSSCGQISPADCPASLLEPFCPQAALEAELAMVRRALDGGVPEGREGRDGFLREFSRLRSAQQEYLNNVLQRVETLTEEKASLKQANTETKEKYRKVRKEMECLKIEHRCQLQEMQQRDGFLTNAEAINHTPEKVKDSCCSQITKELQARLCHYESAYDDLQKENCFLHDELVRHGATICVAAPPRHVINGSLSGGTSPLSSPPSSAGSPSCRLDRLMLPFKKEKGDN